MTDNQKKLIGTLEEMFQFDQADLDFGIYRIMGMKRDEVRKFLNEELPKQITKGLNELLSISDESELIEINKQIENTKKSSLSDNIKSEALQELEEKKRVLISTRNIGGVEADIYNHLTNFFSRYYDEGDFISQRRYKDGVYAIPYEGEEVKLHWANADQYYIKTSEYFKDYTFKTSSGDVIHFKIVEAVTDKDNNKSNDKRFFQIYEDAPFEVINDELYVYLEYKNGGKKSQKDCNAEIVTAFSKVASEYLKFGTIITNVVDGKTLLERQLNRYTARNTFDYFIHKDLSKFLNRELDFYIKNEVIFLDDIDEQNDNKIKEYLTKAKIIRKIAKKIITFLAQIEDFQKMLFLKKKFVVETNYCITLDKIPTKFYDEIIANKEQINEWIRLFAIDEIEGVSSNLYDEKLNKEFLIQNPFLVVDTAFFSNTFKEKLIDELDDLDEKLDGLMIHSENFQALNLLQEKYKEKIKCVYIDPPYNTDASKIVYKNGYEHSSWVSLMESRLMMAKELMNDKSVIELAIDDYEFRYINMLMDNVFGIENAISNIAIFTNPKGRDQGFIAQAHDYTIMYAKCKENAETNNFILSAEEMAKKFSKSKEGAAARELPLKRTGTGKRREERPYMFFPFLYHIESQQLSVISKEEYAGIYDSSQKTFNDDFLDLLKRKYEDKGYAFILPMSEQGEFLRWRWGYNSCVDGVKSGVLFVKQTKVGYAVYQIDMGDDEVTPKSMWIGERYDASSKGTNLLADIIPNNPFTYPKSIFTVEDNLCIGSSDGDTVMDFFAGSGTTGHAVINLSRNGKGKRKYILVEMGEYFDEVTRTRIEKVIYSNEWKKGKPITRQGSSHAMKYIRLESYEDALNNIKLNTRDLSLLGGIKEEYLLSYMLNAESKGSPSILNIEQLSKPFSYKMNITKNLQSKEINIDLVETFNFLIGLNIERSYALASFDAEFKQGEYGVTTAKLKDGDTYKIKMIEGKTQNNESILIIWRELTGDTVKDNAVLDAFFNKKKISTTDFEYKKIYVNGDNNLQNIRTDQEDWKVILIEDEMKKRMFEDIN